MLRTLLIIFSILGSGVAAHATVVKADKSAPIHITISNHDANKISIQHGFITSATAPKDGRIILSKDEDSGSIFIRMNKNVSSEPFTIFLRDSRKQNYTLYVSPSRVPGQHIIIEPLNGVQGAKQRKKSLRRTELIYYIMSGMIEKRSMPRCKTTQILQSVPLWKGSQFTLTHRYRCGRYVGRVYDLVNTDSKDMRIVEQEFYKQGTVAVSIANHELGQNEGTKIYVIEEVSHD